MSLTELKKHLRKKSDKELIEEIADLYKKFDEVKEYYQASFFKDDASVLEKYKQIVFNEFSPSKSELQCPKLRASVARKAISDYKKISCSDHGVADIMLAYVESGVECTREFGDINESFYISMESMYEKALKFIVKHNLQSQFQSRLKAIINDSKDTGWGFNEQLADVFAEYMSELISYE